MPKQDQKLINFITSRQSKLESEKTNREDRMQDIADFVAPHRDDIRGNNVKDEKRGRKIFDGTAVSAAVLATDGIHGYHVSPAFAWFKYKMNRNNVNKIAEVREWLDELEFNMYAALNRSNFYGEMWSYIYDGFTMGTASIYPEEDLAEEKISFETIHPGEMYIAENKYGEVDVMHRKKKLTSRQLVQRFGLENLPEGIKTNYKDQPFQENEVIHAVYPREDFDTRKNDAKNKRFASTWLITEGNHIARSPAHLALESGLDDFPFHTWRYMKTGKSPWGTCPAELAMSDIKGINLMSKTLLGAAQLAVDPAYNVPSYLEGQVQLKPRGLNYIKGGSGDNITPVDTGSKYPVGIDREERKQKMIERRFHLDTFLLLTQLNLQGGSRTLGEVNELMAEKAAVLGAELGPFNKQTSSILDHVFRIETNAGRMPEAPDILQEMAAEDKTLRFDPEYQGPLAQAQQERFKKDPIRKFIIDLAPLIEIDEEVKDNFDWDEGSRFLGEVNNIPASMVNSRNKVVKIREGRAQVETEAQQQEQIAAALEGGKVASEIDKNLGGQLSGGGSASPAGL